VLAISIVLKVLLNCAVYVLLTVFSAPMQVIHVLAVTIQLFFKMVFALADAQAIGSIN
jgi:hypothetical protein